MLLLFYLLPGKMGSLARAWQQDPTQTPGKAAVKIVIPEPGSALQGKTTVIGTTAIENMAGFELAFAYSENPTDTWFLIAEGQEAILDGVLAEWDTTTISDGDYDLRLLVFLTGGEEITYIVRAVRVRNYTPVETFTPTVPASTETPNPSKTPLPTLTATPAPTATAVYHTPTALPPNPAQLSDNQVLESIGWGALGSLGLITLFVLYLGLRAVFRKGWRA